MIKKILKGKSLIFLMLIAVMFVTSCWTPPKQHVIVFISDGTQLEHYIATSRYLFGRDDGLVFQKGMDYEGYTTTWDASTYNGYAADLSVEPYDPENFDPVVGYDPSLGGWAPYPICFLDTQEAYFDNDYATYQKYHVTDSASAATALFTGHKAITKTIGYDSLGNKVKTIAEYVREQKGLAIGTCSVVPFTHATPAAFVAHSPVRDAYTDLAEEMINEFAPEVVIGGGYPSDVFGNPFQYISEDQYNGLFASSEYMVAQRQADVNGGKALLKVAKKAAKKGKKLFGLYGLADYDGYSDHYIQAAAPVDQPGCPTFSYDTNEDPNLADIVEAAITVLKEDEDGFLVMFEGGDIDWANHYADYNWMIGATAEFNLAVAKAIAMVNKPGDDMDWSNTTLIITSDHANSFMRLTDDPILGKGDLPNEIVDEETGDVIGLEGVTYSKYMPYHTNEPVMLWAKGNKACEFKKYEGKLYPGTKLIDNTDVFKTLADIMGIEVDE